MEFSGRLNATRAPTKGKARKGTKLEVSLTVLTVIQLPGDWADWARIDSAPAATNMATQSAASDKASHVETRTIALGTIRLRSLVPSVTTILYSTTVSRALRQLLRRGALSRFSKTPYLHADPRTAYECLSFRPTPPRIRARELCCSLQSTQDFHLLCRLPPRVFSGGSTPCMMPSAGLLRIG